MRSHSAGLGYEELAVQEGVAAQRAFIEAIDPECSAERKARLDQALRAYCRRDTEAMIALFRKLVEAPAATG